jgi:hypothetical protein
MVLSIHEVTEAIESEGRKLGKLVNEINDAAHKDAVAEIAYKSATAKARIQFRLDHEKATVGATDDHAQVAAESEHLAHLVARNQLMVLRDSLRATTARLDALRSIITTVRAAGG